MTETNGIFFVKRIDEKLDCMRKKRAELLRDLELPRNAISNWEDRGNIPAGDICIRIAEYLGVSVEWLVTGKEKGLSHEERQLLRQWKILTPDQKDTLRTLLDKWECDYQAREKIALNA